MESPNAENFQLGKGVLYFNQKVDGVYQGELDLGNAPNFSFNMTLEKLEHFSSRGGLKAKDKSVVSQITPACAFTLDEVNMANLELLTMGTTTEVVQAGQTIDDELVTVVTLGRRYQLSERGISAVTVADDDVPTITYVEGPASDPLNNYEISTVLKDDVIGRILVHADQSGCADPIAVDQVLYVSFTSAAVTYNEIATFAQTDIEGILHFVSDNPVGGDQEAMIWRCSLAPDGDTALIGDDWSTLAFTGEILKDEANHASNPYMKITIPA